MGLFDAAMRIIFAGFAALLAVYVGHGAAHGDALNTTVAWVGMWMTWAMVDLWVDRKKVR